MSKFEQELKINKLALDEEWLRQPSLYHEWSENHSQALLERDKAKQQLDLMKSELDLEIRKNPAAFGIDKPTENAISNVIIVSDRYQKDLEAVQKSQYDVNVIAGAVEALSHKKSALDNLTRLFLSGYWSEGKQSPTGINIETKLHEEQNKELAQNPRMKKLVRK